MRQALLQARVTPEQHFEASAWAKEAKLTLTDFVRIAVQERIERMTRERTNKQMIEWFDALERLGATKKEIWRLLHITNDAGLCAIDLKPYEAKEMIDSGV